MIHTLTLRAAAACLLTLTCVVCVSADQRLQSAIRPGTLLVAELSPEVLDIASQLADFERHQRSLDALKQLAAGEDILVTVEIPHSPHQAFVQIHLSDKTDANKLAAQLEMLGLPPAKKHDAGFAVSVFRSWQLDSETALVDPVADDRITAFADALALHADSPARAAVIVPDYFARTLRETTPNLPSALGSVSTPVVLDGAKTLSIGMSPDDLKLTAIATAKNAAAAAKFKNICVALLQSLETANATSEVSVPVLLKPLLVALPDVEIVTEGNTAEITIAGGNPKTAETLIQLVRRMMLPIERSRVSNSLKEVVLAFHNYESANRSFPPAKNARGEDGKPLLSWRVHILPYLGEGELYDQFHLDEPWDSEHNITLLDQMPAVFAPAVMANPELSLGKALIQAPVGDKTIAGRDKPVTFSQITDGTSNTILLVVTTADRAVPWTKPADYEVNSDAPTEGLELDENGAFACAFADGSAHFMEASLGDKINAFYSMNGGEVVTW